MGLNKIETVQTSDLLVCTIIGYTIFGCTILGCTILGCNLFTREGKGVGGWSSWMFTDTGI